MDNKEIFERISELLAGLDDIQHEIHQIRLRCPHSKTFVDMYSWREGQMSPQRICSACYALVEGITEKEAKECWDEYNKTYSSILGTKVETIQ